MDVDGSTTGLDNNMCGVEDGLPTCVVDAAQDNFTLHGEETQQPTVKKVLTSTVCNCLQTTVGDIVFMVLSLGLRHNLTWTAQEDILKMFASIFENEEIPVCKKSIFSIMNSSDRDMTYQIYCPICETSLGVRHQDKCSVKCKKCAESSVNWDDVGNNVCLKCNSVLGTTKDGKRFITCWQCKRPTSTLDPSNFFVTLSLEKQFQNLLSDEKIANLMMTHRFTRRKNNNEALEDIFDGEEYQKHFQSGGILSNASNFSYSFNTDGISTGKSTGKTMWPIYVTINELPPKLRYQNIMLCGLYVGKKDPNQLLFLQPFVDEANKLVDEGFSWKHRERLVHSKVLPLCAIVDSVARFQILNMQSFHAYYGCTYCYQKQKPTAPRKRRFDVRDDVAEERTFASTYDDAVKAYERRSFAKPEDRQWRGVKGPSVLMGLSHFNLIWGFSIDFMHAVLLGIAKTHMKLMFESSRRKYWLHESDRYAIADIFNDIDKRLLNIKPTTGITRVPRSISMWKLWKASEWRAWLLFYCIPCLVGLVKTKYLLHLAMLSRAISLLLQSSVTRAEVDEAHALLLEYCRLFQKYFDHQDTIYNLHLLTHLKKNVLKWGPLWTANTFCYEGQNRQLLQLYKSPNNVLYQIVRRFLIYSDMPSFCDLFVTTYSALEFSEDLLHKRLSRVIPFSNGILLGKGHKLSLTDEEKELLHQCHGVTSTECLGYKRMIYKGMRITTADYSIGKANDDSVVMCLTGTIMKVKFIIACPNQTPLLIGEKVVKLKKLVVESKKVIIDHVRSVKRNGSTMVVSLEDLQCQCVCMHVSENSVYVSPLPLGCRGD